MNFIDSLSNVFSRLLSFSLSSAAQVSFYFRQLYTLLKQEATVRYSNQFLTHSGGLL